MSTATLIIRTGLQGHGKTLNTIKEVDQKAFKEGRTVYFNNVTDLDASKLKADWFPFDDPHKWFELPNDAIIVVDEAQGFFGVRDPRKEVPEYASAFEVMRKQGHEVHLITQDPRFIDVHVRRLCGTHIHYSRVFGSSNVARYQTERVFNEVEKISSNKLADRTIIKLDKKYFDVYSSAKGQHHFKFKPSKKAIFFACATVVTMWLCYRAYDRLTKDEEPQPPTAEATQSKSALDTASSLATGAMGSLLGPATQGEGKPQTRAQYLASLEPRVSDIPSSAPVYDNLTQPQTHPRLFCVLSTDPALVERTDAPKSSVDGVPTSCQCYTQQVTRVETSFGFCLTAANKGYFDNTRPAYNTNQNMMPPQAAGMNISNPSNQPAPAQLSQSPRITVVEYEKGQFLW
tara:strand:- start:3981 stop:5186 length:1206 start_codon:yes stop_codon:yes gene_type:complete